MLRRVFAAAFVTILISQSAFAQKGTFSTPLISCADATKSSITLEVCAGTTGAPAGFSVQWMTLSDFVDNGYQWYSSDDPRLCKASFSGNANDSRYELGPLDCVEIQIGDNLFDDPGASSNCANESLNCDTTYVFRAFVHANRTLKRSAFTDNLECTTLPCDEQCFALSQGYWKTHPESWPTSVVNAGGMSLGDNFYTLAELYAILWQTPAGGNQIVSLAHQLIAVEFSLAAFGENPDDDISAAVDAAHATIGSLVLPPVGNGFAKGGDIPALTAALDAYIQRNHCDELQ